MYESVERAGRLREMTVVAIVRSDAIEDEVEAVGKVGDAGPQAVEIEAVLNVGALDFAEHFVALEAAEPRVSE